MITPSDTFPVKVCKPYKYMTFEGSDWHLLGFS